MNKKTLAFTLGGAIATSFAVAPLLNAAENPFSMQTLGGSQQLAEAGQKMKDGKCGEGKCSGKTKMKAEAKANAKVREGQCGANKMKEGGCSGSMKMEESAAGSAKEPVQQ